MASVGKREWTYNGKKSSAWIVRWTNRAGKQESKQFRLQKQAVAYRLKVETELEAGTHVKASDRATIAMVADSYAKQCEQRLRDGLLSRSRHAVVTSIIRVHILSHFGPGKKIGDLEWEDLDAFRAALIAKKLGAPTRQNCLKVLKAIELYARKRGWVRKTIVGDFMAEAGRPPRDKKIKTFTIDQIVHLLRIVHEHQNRVQARSAMLRRIAINLAACCSLRYGEVMGLTLDSIDFAARMVRVRNSLNAWDELKGPKTNSGIRDVPLPDHLAGYLREWIKSFYVENDRKLLFRTKTDGPYSASSFHRQLWHPALRRASLLSDDGDQFHFHALRHFTSSLMIERGFSATAVAAQMGHSSFDMTLQVYAHPVVTGTVRDERFDRMIDGITPFAEPLKLAAQVGDNGS